MDQKENNKILLLHRPLTGGGGEAWARLGKALKTLAPLDLREIDAPPADLAQLSAEYAHVFLDLQAANAAVLGETPIANLVLVSENAFAWNDVQLRAHFEAALVKHSCLVLDGTSAADLVRLLHLFTSPKRLAGVTPVLEKGSLVLAEKVQSLEGIGLMGDRLAIFLSKLEGFELSKRAVDLRFALSVLVNEAFQRTLEAQQPYPTVDFQVGASRGKLAMNLRFPRGNLELAQIRSLALLGQSFAWNQLWLCADLCLVTHHTQYDELEVMLVIQGAARPSGGAFRTFLLKTSDRSAKKENLLAAPQNFEFRLLSEVRLSNQEQIYVSTDLSEDPSLDLNTLPETVVRKLEKLTEEREFFQVQSKKREEQIREAATKMVQANREISLKRSELLKVTKGSENQIEHLQREIAALEKKLLQQQQTPAFQAAAKDSGVTAQAMQELKTKLEASVKAAENERAQANEKIAHEQRKVASYEQKYSTLFKDIAAKEKEIRDLKAAALKNQKEKAAHSSSSESSSDGAGADALQAKLKETEARETTLKQEVKRVSFKAENTEKHMKAMQLESNEKIKLLEQKLQEAKAKEVELLKKVDELSGALKKAAKAA